MTDRRHGREAFDLLAEINGAVRREYRSSSVNAEVGLPPFQSQLISLVARYPTWSQQLLGEALGRDKGQVARALRELETIGLIARVAVGGDWRTKGAKLTSKGEAVYQALEDERGRIAERAAGELSGEEYELLMTLLTKIRSSFEN